MGRMADERADDAVLGPGPGRRSRRRDRGTAPTLELLAPRPAPTGLARADAAVGDPARERRVKALAMTAPIHALQANRTARPGWERYDLYELALGAIDAVVDRMGFDSGIPRRELDGLVALEAARAVPDAPPGQHREVAAHLVGALTDPQTSGYTAAADGRRRRFDFRLLDEMEGTDGIYLRATREAINVLVGALDTDLESAHAAAEARLENLIRRGRLPEAAQAAQDARYLSVEYMVEVARFIADTRRDIRTADWAERIPARLAEMLDHLDERMTEEQKLLAAMRETRDEAEDPELARQAAALVATVEDCYARHTELHLQIMAADRAFFEEQQRQVFARLPSLRAVDLTDELLAPLLAAPIARVEGPLLRFAERLWGPRVPIVARWGSAVAYLLQAPVEHDTAGEPIEEPEWADPVVDPRLFDDATWHAASAILDLDPAAPPVRLSALVAAARAAAAEPLERLVRLRVMTALSPDFGAARPGGPAILAAAVDGTALPAASGLWGDDPLVGTFAPADELAPPEPEAALADDDPHEPAQLALPRGTVA